MTVVGQSQRTNFHAEELTTETATKQCQRKSNRAGPRTIEPEVSSSKGGYPEIWSVSNLIYTFQISEPGNTFREEYRVSPAECCTIWNLGFECIPRVAKSGMCAALRAVEHHFTQSTEQYSTLHSLTVRYMPNDYSE